MAPIPFKIQSQPGVKRDGTRFEGDYHVDGLWMRFQRGLPRKMGGYRALTNALSGPARGMRSFSTRGLTHVNIGSSGALEHLALDGAGLATAVSNRTPAGFTAAPDNMWQMDVIFDTITSKPTLIAHATPSLTDIDSPDQTPIYYGDMVGNAPLTPIPTAPLVAGGVVALHPYLLAYDRDGAIYWSGPNRPNDWTAFGGGGGGYVTGQKILKGMATRGGGQSPAGVFFSIDSVIRAQFVGAPATFAFDTISTESSVLSAQGFVDYDGIIYWLGVDRILSYSGVVREVPNTVNQDWFFRNLNFAHRQKVFAVKVPRFGEIWWCFPKGDATECNHALIFNVREQSWYDTALPADMRSAGHFPNAFPYPLMVSAAPYASTSKYTLWQHEFGVNEVNGSSIRPIRSYYETGDISLLAGQQGQNKSLRCALIEPDFIQRGDMSVTICGRINARAPEVESQPYTFKASAANGDEELVYPKDIRREMRFRFESNTIDGDYQAGQSFAHLEPADGRVRT